MNNDVVLCFELNWLIRWLKRVGDEEKKKKKSGRLVIMWASQFEYHYNKAGREVISASEQREETYILRWIAIFI